MTKRADVLPLSLPPRGLSRAEAAAYIGVGTTLFDTMIAERTMPGPKQIHGRTVWDRLKLDQAFAALPERDGNCDVNPWDKYLATPQKRKWEFEA